MLLFVIIDIYKFVFVYIFVYILLIFNFNINDEFDRIGYFCNTKLF
jgi:hypothetical protein